MAAWGFSVLGAEAKAGVPGLAKLLRDRDPEVRIIAANCLGSIGAEAVGAAPALIDALRPVAPGDRTNEVLQTMLSFALGEIGPGAEAALPILCTWTNDFAQLAVLRIRGRLTGAVS